MLFSELGLSPALLKSLEQSGYTTATPIQAQAIPLILQGKDILGVAQTGTGKTAAFALPSLQRIAEMKVATGSNKSIIRCLILVPTRELALQVNTSFNKYGRNGLGGPDGIGVPLRYAVVFGGVNQFRQVESIRSGIDILVATPGRLQDLQGQGLLDLSQVELFILDEADQMLDMGFIIPIRKIASQIKRQRQTLMFSATMPREIKQLAHELLKDYTEVAVAPQGTAAELVEQQAYLIDQRNKGALLRHYIKEQSAWKTLVFTKTKHGADRVTRGLLKSGVKAAAIHGNRSQPQRTRALDAFKKGDIAVLVATDVAARGLHITDVSHVINYDLPEVPETYIHRIGRTGRAGASGIAVSFVDSGDKSKLRSIERLVKKPITILPTPEVQASAADRDDHPDNDRGDRNDRRGGGGGGGSSRGRSNDRQDFRDNRGGGYRDNGGPRDNGGFRDRQDRPQFQNDRSAPTDRPAPTGNRAHFQRPEPRPSKAPAAASAAFADPAPKKPAHAPKPHASTAPHTTHTKPAHAPKPHHAAAAPHAKPAHAPKHTSPADPTIHRTRTAPTGTGKHPTKTGGTGKPPFNKFAGKPGGKTFGNKKFGGPASGKRQGFRRDGGR